jgi:histidyl-tRNA synthetase
VRGLDYYTHTVFEFVAEGIGAKNSVCGGGRYNDLVKDLGGKHTPAVGFGMGIERMILLLEEQDIAVNWMPKFQCAWLDESCKQAAYELATELRVQGIECRFDYQLKSLKNQMSKASKDNCIGVFIIGDDEIAKEQVTYKHLSSGKQRTVSTQRLIRYFGQLRISPEIDLNRELEEWIETQGK